MMATKKPIFDWKKTAKKGLYTFGWVFIAGLLTLKTQNVMYLAVVPVLEMAKNVLKHKLNAKI